MHEETTFSATEQITKVPDDWTTDTDADPGTLYAIAVQPGVLDTHRVFEDGAVWDGPLLTHHAVRVLYATPAGERVAYREYWTTVTSTGESEKYDCPEDFATTLDAEGEPVDSVEYAKQYAELVAEHYGETETAEALTPDAE